MFALVRMLSVFILFGVPAGLVGIPWTLLTRNIRWMYRTGEWIAHAGLRAAGIRINVAGRELIPNSGACIYLANHISNLDPPVLIPLLPGTPSVMVKAQLMRIPILGAAMRLCKFVAVERTGSREGALRSAKAAAEVLRSGTSMLIFGEGTRSPTGRLQPFKAGPFHLAQAADVPIVPVVIYGTEHMMRKGSARVYPGVAHVRFLPPVKISTYATRADVTAAIRAAMIAVLPETMHPQN